MDAARFDALIRSVAQAGTRRWLLRRLAALPLVGALAVVGDEEAVAERPHERLQRRTKQRNRKQRNERRRNDDENTKNKNKNKNKKKNSKNGGGGRRGGPDPCLPDGSACTEGSQCCGGNCFDFVCADRVNQCSAGGAPIACDPPASGCCEQDVAPCCDPPANQCNLAGLCCAPNCAERECGPDGCGQGGTCGSCPACQTCDVPSGQCVPDPSQDRTVCAGTGSETSVCCDGTCCAGCCGGDGSCGDCLVFVTADPQFQGNLGGLTGADETCRQRAAAESLPGSAITGNYKAWLSTDQAGQNPATRFRHADQPYRLPDAARTQVASDWAGLTTCGPGGQFAACLDHAINITETGDHVSADPFSWTNTATDGAAKGGNDCDNWTSNDGHSFEGGIGSAEDNDTFWTDSGLETCNGVNHLYCFQQT